MLQASQVLTPRDHPAETCPHKSLLALQPPPSSASLGDGHLRLSVGARLLTAGHRPHVTLGLLRAASGEPEPQQDTSEGLVLSRGGTMAKAWGGHVVAMCGKGLRQEVLDPRGSGPSPLCGVWRMEVLKMTAQFYFPGQGQSICVIFQLSR